MTSTLLRLDRLRERFRPPTCFSTGSYCERTELIGDGGEDPPLPDLPATCPHCGRPARWQIVRLVGVDVDRL